MLSREEAVKYGASDTDAGAAVREILHDAGENFNTGGGRVFVQLYQSKGGGCELFVTRLCAFADAAVDTDKKPEGVSQLKYRVRQTDAAPCGIYRFNSVGDLIEACARFITMGTFDDSAAYCDGCECYIVFGRACSGAELLCGEYGAEESDPYTMLYIKEHCRLICAENAVATLAKLA